MRLPILALITILSAVSCGRPPEGTPARRAQQARELQSRLMAPCCWQQTLDVHTGPLVDQLRDEIDRRLNAGEAPAVIEEDLVKRYGERIRALPKGRSLNPLGWGLIIGAGLGGVGAILVGVRWVRRGRRKARAEAEARPPAPPEKRSGDAALEDRLDEELEEMD